MTIGERIRKLRHEQHMSMEDVGKYLSISRATVCRYEDGSISNIPSDKLEALSRLFGVSPAYLMGWNENRVEEIPPDDEPRTDDVRLLVRDLNKLSDEQIEQAKSMFRLMFTITNPELFKEDDDNDT